MASHNIFFYVFFLFQKKLLQQQHKTVKNISILHLIYHLDETVVMV